MSSLLFSATGLHTRPLLTSAGILPKKRVRKEDRIKLALNSYHCFKPLPLVQFSNNLQRKVDRWSWTVVLKFNCRKITIALTGNTVELFKSCVKLAAYGWTGLAFTPTQDCTAIQPHQWLQQQTTDFSEKLCKQKLCRIIIAAPSWAF